MRERFWSFCFLVAARNVYGRNSRDIQARNAPTQELISASTIMNSSDPVDAITVVNICPSDWSFHLHSGQRGGAKARTCEDRLSWMDHIHKRNCLNMNDNIDNSDGI